MGSVQKRTYTEGKPPRYVARIKSGGREQTKSFARQADAKQWIISREGLKPSGGRVDNLTVDQAFRQRLHDPDLAASTLSARRNVYRDLGRLRHMKVGAVTPADVKLWRLELLEGREWAGNKPLASSTVANYLGQLSAMFNEAVEHGQIPRNPARRKRVRYSPPRVDPHDLISEEHIKQLIDAAEGDLALMIRLGTVSGLRVGELCGLRCRNIRGGLVEVREQSAGRGKAAWRPLKTPSSIRDVPIPESVEKALQEHVEECGRAPAEPLFVSKRGNQYRKDTAGAAWRWMAEQHNLPMTHSWHALRHYYATKLIQSGASVTTVQHRLGHAKPGVTLETYSHFWPGEDDRTRAVFADW
jgi:integrase